MPLRRCYKLASVRYGEPSFSVIYALQMQYAGGDRVQNASSEQTAANALVHVRFLGTLEVRVLGSVVTFPTRHATLLFAYLAAAPGVPRTRSHLGGLFWGNRGEEQARGSLRQTIFRIRRTLGTAETQVISADAQSVGVIPTAIASDLAELEQFISTEPPGDFLAGWDGLSTDLDVWIASERARINETLHGMLQSSASDAETRGDFQSLVTLARRMLVVDPYDENAAQFLMKALARTGNTAAANEAFRTFQQRLGDDLQLAPSQDTNDLATEISERKGAYGQHDKPVPSKAELAPAFDSDMVRELRMVTVVSAWAQPREGESTSNPEQVLNIRKRCEPAFDRILERYGGTADRAPGLISVSYFGWPIADEDAARQAVDAAIAFQQISNCRIGISSGEMLIEPGLDPIGSPPDDAVELMSRAGQSEILVSETIRELVGERYLFENLSGGEARVLGPASLPGRFSARDSVEAIKMIGRDRERELLLDRLQRAEAGEGQVVIVTGEPGIGKSRLQEEIAREALKRDARCKLLQCRRMGQGLPFQPLLDHITIAAGISQSEEPATRQRRLHAHLEEAGVIAEEHVQAIGELLGVVDPNSTAGADPEQRRALQFAALAAYFLSAQGGWLTFVVLEDAHWADPSTLQLVENLASSLGGSKLFLLITGRPEFDASRFHGRFRTDLSLNSLGREETEQLIGSYLPHGDHAAETLARIAEQSDGVPLFVEQMARWYTEHPQQLENDAVGQPVTLKALLETRLAGLGSHRRVAQRAACVGRQFDRATLLNACSRDPKDVDAAIAEMLRSRLIFRFLGASGEEFSFTHALLAETAYESLPEDDRQETHKLILASMSGAGSRPAGDRAHQAEAATLHEEAMDLYREAGKTALSVFAHQEARAHFSKALAQFPHLHFSEQNEDARVDIVGKLSLCSAHALGYNHPETVHMLREAQQLAVSRPEAPAAIPILWQTYSLHYTQGDGERTREIGERVLSLSAWNHEFGSQEALGNRFLAGGHMLLGEFEAAEQAFAAASEALVRIDAPNSVKAMGIDQLIPIGMLRARVRAILGQVDEALELTEQTLETAHRLQLTQPSITAHVLSSQTMLILGDFDRAQELAGIGLTIAQENNSAMWAAYARCIVGIAKAHEGALEESRSAFHAGRDTLTRSRTVVSTSILDANFAAELAGHGLIEEATKRFDTTMAFIESGGEPWTAPEVIRLDLVSNSITKRHDNETWISLKQRAETLAARQGARLWSDRLSALNFQ